MNPPYGPINNPNQEVVLDVVDAEPMTPTETSPFNDELESSDCEYFDAKSDTLIGDGDRGEEISDNNTTAPPSIESNDHSDGDGSHRDGNEDALVDYEDTHCKDCKKKEEKQRFLKRDKLYKAALKGDWKTAKSIFDLDPSAVTMKIDCEDTALDIAIIAKQTAFVVKLVNLMRSEDKTPLPFEIAAASGELRIVKVLVENNPELSDIDEFVVIALTFQSKDIASFLFSKIIDLKGIELSKQMDILQLTIHSDYYDMALEILKKNPQLAKERHIDTNMTALHILARKENAIGSSGKLSIWKRCINYGFKGFYNKALMKTLAHQLVDLLWNAAVNEFTKEELLKFINTPSPLLHDAASVGNVEFLIIILNTYPYLMSTAIVDCKKSIFHTAIENRQENVFSLIYEIGVLKSIIDQTDNIETNLNMIALAGKIADPIHLNRVSGAALQMQRELSWFKEVEKIMQPYYKRDGETKVIKPRELFTKEHKQLLKDGEEWMKSTANSCMLVATLIATVVFAAAFTVPGGIDNNTGTPIFRRKDSFTIFIISDVTALVSSTTSILIFLSILTSRYTEDDFLVSLPRKLLFGIVTLFFSIVCMIVAFSATIFMVYDKAKSEILLAIIVGAIIPVCCFCVLHSKLVLEILRSTGWFGFASRFRKRRLFI